MLNAQLRVAYDNWVARFGKALSYENWLHPHVRENFLRENKHGVYATPAEVP